MEEFQLLQGGKIKKRLDYTNKKKGGVRKIESSDYSKFSKTELKENPSH